jgi:P-type Mg2+ transporter
VVANEGESKPKGQLQTTTSVEYSSLPSSEIFRVLGTGVKGLSAEESEKRLRIHGPNELPRERPTWLGILLNQFRNPMFLILLIVALASGILGQPEQAAIILLIMGFSVVLGFYNEFRAERLVEELQGSVSIKAVVMRDGKTAEVDSSCIVPGDLLQVYIGDIVAADTRIIDSKELEVNESLLTGESFAVEKNTEAPAGARPPSTPSEASNMLFMGTVVVRGTGRGIVVSTGISTAFGSISKSLSRAHPETEFQRGTKRYGNLLLFLTFFLAIGIFGFNALVGHSLLNSLLFALAVAIGIVPEMMPGIVTIALSRGAHKMAEQQVIVKRLASMENLGNVDVLCTDKTGTLTEGRIALKSVLGPDLKPDPGALPMALACNTAVVGSDWKVTGNPMDAATWEYAIQHNFDDSASAFSKVDEIPFDYERRMMSVIARKDAGLVIITKGAPESVLRRCSEIALDGGAKKAAMTAELTKDLEADVGSYSREGLRTLAVSYRSIEEKSKYSHDDESGLTLAGFLAFMDPPKRDAAQAISKLKILGVDTKILTGDNEIVAKKTCDDIGVQVKKVVTGGELVLMNWADFKTVAEETTIFARVTPEQKLEVIKALKENGHVVAYLGDGVNDAPALYEADAGISVDSAVDVSKEAADIILLKKDLGVLAAGIEEGRRTFGNTIKYVLMGTSSNFGNMFSASAASVFLPFLPMLPMQILFMNLLYNVANLTLPTDNVDPEYTKWPKKWDIGFVRNFTLFFGPFSSVYDFLTFGIMLFIFGASAPLFQSAWFVESFWTEVLIIFVIRTRRMPFFTSRPGKWLTVLTLGAVAFGTALPFTQLGALMGFVPLPPQFWVLLALMTITYLFLVDAGKVFFYKVCGY